MILSQFLSISCFFHHFQIISFSLKSFCVFFLNCIQFSCFCLMKFHFYLSGVFIFTIFFFGLKKSMRKSSWQPTSKTEKLKIVYHNIIKKNHEKSREKSTRIWVDFPHKKSLKIVKLSHPLFKYLISKKYDVKHTTNHQTAVEIMDTRMNTPVTSIF